MDVCGICDSEVFIFYHTAVNLVRQLLLNEYSTLQTEYFEERTNFKYWHDYYTHYYHNYRLKFEVVADAILMCDTYTQRNLSIDTVVEQLSAMGYDNLFPMILIEALLAKEKSIEEVKSELIGFINNKFFNKL